MSCPNWKTFEETGLGGYVTDLTYKVSYTQAELEWESDWQCEAPEQQDVVFCFFVLFHSPWSCSFL